MNRVTVILLSTLVLLTAATSVASAASVNRGVTANINRAAPLARGASGAPVNTAPPTLSGAAKQGATLITTTGAWSGRPSAFSYRWQLCNTAGGSCAKIAGATGSSYVLSASDVGKTVRSAVIASNNHGSGSADSAVMATVQAAGAGSSAPGGDGVLSFTGSFGDPKSNYPNIFGNCYSVASPNEIEFDIRSSCNPAGDGDYRTDLATGKLSGPGNVYPAGQVTCTTVPVQVVSAPGITDNTWLVFTEVVPAGYDGSFTAGWSLGLRSYWTGDTASSPNQFVFSLDDRGTNEYVWHGGTVDSGWHTLSVCSNNATDNSGEILGFWLDGVRQTFNGGSCSGQQTCGGFPMITGSSYPLTIDDYTGGTPNQLNEGAPLIASMGSNGLPPKPAAGWNSP